MTEVPLPFIERIVNELHPHEIWLFGSRAKGTARADSDWDMMAVLPDTASDNDLDLFRLWQRIPDLRVKGVELFTITRTEFDRWRRSLGTLSEIVSREGVVVYAR